MTYVLVGVHNTAVSFGTPRISNLQTYKCTRTNVRGKEAERNEKHIAQQTYCCCPVVNSANKLGGISNTMYSPAIYDSANETGTCCPLLSANCDEAVLMMLSARIERESKRVLIRDETLVHPTTRRYVCFDYQRR